MAQSRAGYSREAAVCRCLLEAGIQESALCVLLDDQGLRAEISLGPPAALVVPWLEANWGIPVVLWSSGEVPLARLCVQRTVALQGTASLESYP